MTIEELRKELESLISEGKANPTDTVFYQPFKGHRSLVWYVEKP